MYDKKICLHLVILALVAGCAEPKYAAGTAAPSPSAQDSKASCLTTFSSSHLCLTWYWEKVPTSTEAGSLVFKTYRLNVLDQSPIETDIPSTPDVVLWMPGMGHGSLPTKTVRLDIGTHRVSDVFFIMPGEWEIKFQIKTETEILDEAKVTLTF